MTVSTLREMFLHDLEDIHYAENELLDALSELADPELYEKRPEEAQSLMQQIQAEVESQRESGLEPVIMAPPAVRRPLRDLVRRQVEDLPVLSYNEIPDDLAVEVVGVIRLQQQESGV